LAQNAKETEDLRVRRTRKLLQEALIELTVERGFAAVTIRDITERAMVNRSTFYRHYLDKYDLLNQFMDEVYESTFSHTFTTGERVGPIPAREVPPGEPPHGPLPLLRHVQQFADFYRVMLGAKGDPLFIQRFRQNTEKRFRVMLAAQGGDDDPNAPPIEMRLSYVSCAGIGAILWWLENNRPCAVEELAGWLSQLSTASAGLTRFAPLPVGE
jgi:AcrR family transcriptional regulator